jgi:hypothetical protein
MKLFPTIAKAWKAFVARRRFLPAVVLVDFLFLYGVLRANHDLLSAAHAELAALLAMIGQQASAVAGAELPENITMMQSPEFLAAFHAFLSKAALFFGSIFLTWLVGKGIVWYLAHRIVEKRTPTKAFALGFFGMSAFWSVLLVIAMPIALKLINDALFTPFPLLGPRAAHIVSFLALWVLAYFAAISYSLIPQPVFKQTFFLGITRWKQLIPVHLVSSLVVFVAATVPVSLIKLNFYLPLAFIVFIALPAIAWSRVFWITAVREAHHGQV